MYTIRNNANHLPLKMYMAYYIDLLSIIQWAFDDVDPLATVGLSGVHCLLNIYIYLRYKFLFNLSVDLNVYIYLQQNLSLDISLIFIEICEYKFVL
jgi:hypothetical protein